MQDHLDHIPIDIFTVVDLSYVKSSLRILRRIVDQYVRRGYIERMEYAEWKESIWKRACIAGQACNVRILFPFLHRSNHKLKHYPVGPSTH
jgi:hypothetical protein